jgi:hypothetical protein
MSDTTLKRDFTFRSAFALAFADVSPIVALYTVFSIVVALAGVAVSAMVGQIMQVNGGEVRCRA